MRNRGRAVRVPVIVSAIALVVSVVAVTPTVGASPSATITPVVGGLAAPRGIAFDGKGAMYVAESGVAGPGSAGMTTTGKVDKFLPGATTPTWSTRFNSLYESEDPTAPPDVLGPNGLSAIGNGCTKNSNGNREGCQVVMITGESTPGVLESSGGAIHDPQAGHLFRLDAASGAATSRSDVGTQMYDFTTARTDLFPSDFPDSNPYGVLVTKDAGGGIRTFVADAGANTISEIRADGTARIVAYIPNETAPPFRDATPTCMAVGPDGFLYVGTLNFVANLFAPGTGDRSHVWRVDPDANFPTVPTVWASGLSTLTACAFDRAGNFWATEMFAGGVSATPPGDIVRIPFRAPTRHDRFGAGQLAVPGGITQGPDGAMYVTVGSAAPGVSGAVMRVQVGG